MAKDQVRNRIRKVGALLCVLCMMLTLVTGTQSVHAAGSTKLAVSTQQAMPGDNVSVTVTLSENTGIWGVKCKVGYDHSVLELTSVANGDIFTDEEVSFSGNLEKDPFVYVACADKMEDKTANGTMVTLNFKVAGTASAGEYPVTLDVTQAINVNGENVTVLAQRGIVRIGGGSGGSSNTDVSCTHNKVWKVTKEATCESEGVETETCTKCGETFGTRSIAATGHKHTEIKNAYSGSDTEMGYTGDTYCKDCGKLIKEGTYIAALKDTRVQLSLRVSDSTDTTSVLKWKKVAGADGYVIYGAPSGTKTAKLAVVKKGSTTTWTSKDLESGSGYKYYIKAYKLVNGKKVWIAKSRVLYAVTDGGEYGNAKAVKVNRTSVKLEEGSTFAIKAEQIPGDLPIKNPSSFKYDSSNSKVATVNSKGVITAKKAGTCYIYVYAQNGVYKKVKVTVK